jgi:hypothetical protein
MPPELGTLPHAGYILGPVLTGLRIPAFSKSSMRLTNIKSQPLAATKLIVTGIYSVLRDIVELYGISPTGTTRSGAPAKTAIRPSENPSGGVVGALEMLTAGLFCFVFPLLDLPEIGISVLRLSLAIRVDVDALGTSLYVGFTKSFGLPPVFEDGFILQCLIVGSITSIFLPPSPSRQGTWVHKWSATIMLYGIIGIEWKTQRAILVNGN